MVDKSQLKELASGRLGPLLVKYSWPALVAMTLNALYAVVDRMFIGQGCGVDAMAGMQLAMPVVMFFSAVGVFIGAGHAAILSIKLGENDRPACERIVGELVALKLLAFLSLPLIVFFNFDTVLWLCGADRVSPAALAAAKAYLVRMLFFQVFSHLAFGLASLQRAEGGARQSMWSMVIGFGCNLLLDPLFIFTFKLGVAGAAWATNLSMIASFAWAIGYYLRGKTVVRLRWRRIGLYRDLLVRSSAIGLAPFLQQLMSSLIVAALQFAFAYWLADATSRTNQIASLSVFNAALILVFMPMCGCQQGLQPIFGYNWGARAFGRVLATLRTGFWVTTALTCWAWLIQVVPPFPQWIAGIFVNGNNPELIRLCAHDLQLSNCMIWCISFNVLATTFFQSIGKPKIAILLSMLRQGLVLLPIIVILPFFMEDKAFAIWLSMPISDVICNLATIPPLLTHAKFLHRLTEHLKGKTPR